MSVTSPFGFISYNSRDFLQHTLQAFIDEGKFLRCACWYHESTGNEKNHFHCWVEPAVQMETGSIANEFVEILENGDKQSIAIRPKCGSKWNDAYLYGIHDDEYLSSKSLEREEVNIQSDKHIYLGDFAADIEQAQIYKFKVCLSPYARLKALFEMGKTIEEVYDILRIPFSQLYSVGQAYNSISREKKRLKREEDFAKVNEMLGIKEEENNSLSPFDIEQMKFEQTKGDKK